MKAKIGCTAIIYGGNSTALLNDLRGRIGNRKTVITCNGFYDIPKATRFGVIQILRWGKGEYRGVLNIVQVY